MRSNALLFRFPIVLVALLLALPLAAQQSEPSEDGPNIYPRMAARLVDLGVPVPSMSAALNYYDSYRCARLPANLLQAQRDYFENGPEHLTPLPMVQVADQLGIHIGTVSRAVANKYAQTPRGIVPLRMFFSGGITSETGEHP